MARMPQVLLGAWHDLNWIGSQSPTPALNLTSLLRLVTGPLLFSKVFPPFALFLMGLGAWVFFKELGLSALACVTGALAAVLSSHFLSTACWGVASQVIAFGMDFFALALLVRPKSKYRIIRTILAGLLVGMNIMEAYDIGAIFSMFIAAFILFQSFQTETSRSAKVIKGMLGVVVVAVFAGFLASESLVSLIGTQIQGVVGKGESQQSKDEKWDWATQWSMPVQELPRIIIPGLYGYRMDTPKDMEAFGGAFEGGNYWGKVGETPGWTEHHKDPEWNRAHQRAYPRFSGGGEYAGLPVVALAIWALAQAFRKKNSAFSMTRSLPICWRVSPSSGYKNTRSMSDE